MNLKKLIFSNLHLKLLALFMALLVWGIIVGQARAYSEKAVEVGVTYVGVSPQIDVRDVQPARVLVTLYGISTVIEALNSSQCSLNLDLKNIQRAGESTFFAQDHLLVPEGLEVRQIQPRIVRVITDEFSTREVPIRIVYKGKFPQGVRLLERRLSQDRVTMFGYLSQILKIGRVEGEFAVDLGAIDRSQTVKVPLRKEDGVIRFEDISFVEVIFEVAEQKSANVDGKTGSPDEQ